jgi:hypothetical protein
VSTQPIHPHRQRHFANRPAKRRAARPGADRRSRPRLSHRRRHDVRLSDPNGLPRRHGLGEEVRRRVKAQSASTCCGNRRIGVPARRAASALPSLGPRRTRSVAGRRQGCADGLRQAGCGIAKSTSAATWQAGKRWARPDGLQRPRPLRRTASGHTQSAHFYTHSGVLASALAMDGRRPSACSPPTISLPRRQTSMSTA